MRLSQVGILLSFPSQNSSVRYLPGFGPVVPQECSDCGKKFNMGGPIWSAPIHDQEWVTSILADVKSMKDRYPAYDRISAVLTTISEVCFFCDVSNLKSQFMMHFTLVVTYCEQLNMSRDFLSLCILMRSTQYRNNFLM